MIDFHTHILPGIDDGSDNIKESLSLLRMEADQGVDRIVLTPHFYADRDGRDYFARREASYRQLLSGVQSSPFEAFTFLLGAEVCYFTGIGEAGVARRLCIGDSRWMLLELPFAQWDERVLTDIKKLIEVQGLRLVIAHVERYYPYQKNRAIWDQIFSLPVVPQINAGAFLHRWTTKRRVSGWVRQGLRVVMGSDCHNMHSRRPNLEAGRQQMKKAAGQRALDEMDRRAEEVFAGMDTESMDL